MIGRRPLASTRAAGGSGKAAAVKKKRWQLDQADELSEAEASTTKPRPSSQEQRPEKKRGSARAPSPSRSQSRSGDRRGSRSSSPPIRSRSRSRSASGTSALATVAEVTTFSDFVRHCDRLVKLAGTSSAPDLVQLCRNMAQAKYYDGDLVAEVARHLRTQIAAGQHGVEELTDIIMALRELNAYDQGVFHAAAAALLPQAFLLSLEARKFWKETYRDLKHQGDDEFIAALSNSAGAPEADAVSSRSVLTGKSWLRHPGTEASITSSRSKQVLCMLHGKQRSIDMMVDEGNGHYTCLPNRRCR